jgi:hypothetical protein
MNYWWLEQINSEHRRSNTQDLPEPKYTGSIYGAQTIGQLMDAIEDTYYDIFLNMDDIGWGYFSKTDDGRIQALVSERVSPEEDSYRVREWGNHDNIPADTKIRVICYPEDVVLCRAI